MTAKELGEQSAFPALGGLVCLTKRELFAAMAMQGAIAGSQGFLISKAEFAQIGVQQADALLAELAKEKQ